VQAILETIKKKSKILNIKGLEKDAIASTNKKNVHMFYVSKATIIKL
jgi:hypothetical protein